MFILIFYVNIFYNIWMIFIWIHIESLNFFHWNDYFKNSGCIEEQNKSRCFLWNYFYVSVNYSSKEMIHCRKSQCCWPAPFLNDLWPRSPRTLKPRVQAHEEEQWQPQIPWCRQTAEALFLTVKAPLLHCWELVDWRNPRSACLTWLISDWEIQCILTDWFTFDLFLKKLFPKMKITYSFLFVIFYYFGLS